MEVKMVDATHIANFIHAGHALFTVVSTRTGTRFTYKVDKPRDDKKSTMRFVRVLSGPDNERSYKYIGFVQSNTQGRLNAGKKGTPEASSFKALDWIIHKVTSGVMPDELEFYHAGKCGCCGRTLTVPESITSGFGPVCIKRYS